MDAFFKTRVEFEHLDAWRGRFVQRAGGDVCVWPALRVFMLRETGPAEESLLPLAPLADTDGQTSLPPHALQRSADLLLEIIARQQLSTPTVRPAGRMAGVPRPAEPTDDADGVPGNEPNLSLADVRFLSRIWHGHEQLRRRPARNWFNGNVAEDPEWVEPFLGNTLEWFAGGVISALHPVEQTCLMTLRLADLLPFAGWNFYLVRIVAWFYLLRAGFPPPLLTSGDLPSWFEAVRSGHGGLTTDLTRLCQRLVEQSCRRLTPEDS